MGKFIIINKDFKDVMGTKYKKGSIKETKTFATAYRNQLLQEGKIRFASEAESPAEQKNEDDVTGDTKQ